MREVIVDVAELLAVIRHNRDLHQEHFEEALEGWRRTVLRQLEKAVTDARAGHHYRTQFSLPQPEDHTGDYDDVIGMLEMHTAATIALEVREYRQYVTDDWDWKAQFTRTYDSYAAVPSP